MRRTTVYVLVLVLLAGPLMACKSSNEGSWWGAGGGAVAGALIGGIIGNQTDNKWKGAAIGAAVGALAGYIVGTELGASDDDENKNTPQYQQARDLFDRANRESDPQRAIDLYQQAIEVDPRFPEPYNNMGLRYVQLNKREMARGAFEKALQVDPQFQPARDNLTRLNSGSL